MPGVAGVDLATVLRALVAQGASVLREAPSPTEVTRVVLQAPGDPAPPAGALVLWADVDGPVPPAAAVVLREGDASCAQRLPAGTAVLTVPSGEPWTSVHDRVRAALAAPLTPDLFGMADALALAVGGAVAVEDVERRILAFSTVPGQEIDDVRREGILGRRVPEHAERKDWYARLWRSTGPVLFEAGPDSSPRLALGLRSGDERVGSVWVVGDLDVLNPDSEATLTASASALAAAVTAVSGTSGRTRQQRQEGLSQVLQAPAGPDLDALLPAVVVGVGLPGTDGPDDLVRARLADVLSLQAQRRAGTGLAGDLGGAVFAVLPWTSEDRVRSALESVMQRTTPSRASAVVSEVVSTGESLHSAYEQVRLVLDVRDDGHDGVRFLAQHRTLVQLARLGRATDGHVGSHWARAVVAHDAQHGTSYASSLLAWLDAHGDVARAAAALHVHPNTLRYRWNRAVQLFALDLDDGDGRLLLHLELRLHALGLRDAPCEPEGAANS